MKRCCLSNSEGCCVEVVMRALMKNLPRYSVAALSLTVLAILSSCGARDRSSTLGANYPGGGFYGGCIPLGQPISFQGQVTTSLRTFWSAYGGSTYGYYIQAATSSGPTAPIGSTPPPTTNVGLPTPGSGMIGGGMYYGAVNVLTIGGGGYGYSSGQILPDRLPDGPNKISVQLNGSYAGGMGMNNNASISGTLMIDPYSISGPGPMAPYSPVPSPTTPGTIPTGTPTNGLNNGQVCVQGLQLKIAVTAQSGQPIAAQADLMLSSGQRRMVTINPYYVNSMY